MYKRKRNTRVRIKVKNFFIRKAENAAGKINIVKKRALPPSQKQQQQSCSFLYCYCQLICRVKTKYYAHISYFIFIQTPGITFQSPFKID